MVPCRTAAPARKWFSRPIHKRPIHRIHYKPDSYTHLDVYKRQAVRNFECFGEGLHLFWEGNPKALFEYDAEKKDKVLSLIHI